MVRPLPRQSREIPVDFAHPSNSLLRTFPEWSVIHSGGRGRGRHIHPIGNAIQDVKTMTNLSSGWDAIPYQNRAYQRDESLRMVFTDLCGNQRICMLGVNPIPLTNGKWDASMWKITSP